MAYSENLRREAIENDHYRVVVCTGPHQQLVLMSLSPGEGLAEEVHHRNDQIIQVVDGYGELVVDGERYALSPFTTSLIPAGARHEVINRPQTPLKLIMIYSPPLHDARLVQRTGPQCAPDNRGKMQCFHTGGCDCSR